MRRLDITSVGAEFVDGDPSPDSFQQISPSTYAFNPSQLESSVAVVATQGERKVSIPLDREVLEVSAQSGGGLKVDSSNADRFTQQVESYDHWVKVHAARLMGMGTGGMGINAHSPEGQAAMAAANLSSDESRAKSHGALGGTFVDFLRTGRWTEDNPETSVALLRDVQKAIAPFIPEDQRKLFDENMAKIQARLVGSSSPGSGSNPESTETSVSRGPAPVASTATSTSSDSKGSSSGGKKLSFAWSTSVDLNKFDGIPAIVSHQSLRGLVGAVPGSKSRKILVLWFDANTGTQKSEVIIDLTPLLEGVNHAQVFGAAMAGDQIGIAVGRTSDQGWKYLFAFANPVSGTVVRHGELTTEKVFGKPPENEFYSLNLTQLRSGSLIVSGVWSTINFDTHKTTAQFVVMSFKDTLDVNWVKSFQDPIVTFTVDENVFVITQTGAQTQDTKTQATTIRTVDKTTGATKETHEISANTITQWAPLDFQTNAIKVSVGEVFPNSGLIILNAIVPKPDGKGSDTNSAICTAKDDNKKGLWDRYLDPKSSSDSIQCSDTVEGKRLGAILAEGIDEAGAQILIITEKNKALFLRLWQ